jgi:hypothetical protein
VTTELDTAFADMALEMVEAFGPTAIFTDVPGTYDRVTGSAPAGAVLGPFKVSPPFPYEQRYIDGDVIQRRDLRVILPAKGAFVPLLGMTVSLSGVSHIVVTVRPYQSGDDIAAYELQVRA